MLNALKSIFKSKPAVNYAELVAQGAVILDVRSPGEYASGHLRGSINIPLDKLASQTGKLKKDKPIITCCASGMRSSSARSILEAKGYTVYNGGGWANLAGKL